MTECVGLTHQIRQNPSSLWYEVIILSEEQVMFDSCLEKESQFSLMVLHLVYGPHFRASLAPRSIWPTQMAYVVAREGGRERK